MAWTSERSATLIAVVPCPLFQARIRPLSVSNRNDALTPPGSTKPAAVLLKTTPVGPPCTVTTSPCLAPSEPRYRVDLLVPLSETHHGDVALETSPQPLTRSGSVTGATPGWSETSGVTWKVVGSPAESGAATISDAPRTSSPTVRTLGRLSKRRTFIPHSLSDCPLGGAYRGERQTDSGEPEVGLEPTAAGLQNQCSTS